MFGNISLLIYSLVFMCLITICLYKKWLHLDIFDIYIIFVALHFGIYPFIRSLYFGKDVLIDIRNYNPLVISLVFIQVLVIIVLIKGVYTYFPKDIRECLKAGFLIKQWRMINKYVLVLLCMWLIAFQLFSYYKYGVKSYILPDDFNKIGKNLPYWFYSMRTIYNIIAFCGFIGLFSILIKAEGYQKYGWAILTIILVLITTIHGRRFFVNMIVAGVIVWFVDRGENIFQLKYLKLGLGLLVAFLLFSNLFQAYRLPVFQEVGQFNPKKLENPFSAAINFSSTWNNLKLRPGTWEFNLLVFNNQKNKPGMTTNGKITWEGFKSAVPRALWPGKNFYLVDEILANLYGVTTKEVDIGKNLFGIAQVDFGYFSFIIAPLLILFIIIGMGVLVKITIPYPTFLWLFSGNIIYYLINVEENGNEIFYMFRNLLFLAIILLIYIITIRVYSIIFKEKKEF